MDEIKINSHHEVSHLFDDNKHQVTFGEESWWKKVEFRKFPPAEIVGAAMKSKLHFTPKKIADLQRDLIDCKQNIKYDEFVDKYGDSDIAREPVKLAISDLFKAMKQDKTSSFYKHESKQKATEKEDECEDLLSKLKKISKNKDYEFDFIKEDLKKNRDVDFLLTKPLLIKLIVDDRDQYYVINWIDVKNYYMSCASDHKLKQLNHQIAKFNSQYGPGCYLFSGGINSIYSDLEFTLLGTCVLPYKLLEDWINEKQE